MQQSRKATPDEVSLIEFLVCNTSIMMPVNWKESLFVTPMNDGLMGSLYLSFTSGVNLDRVFGVQISECHFLDSDGIDVIVSLNIDKDGDLFELDIWKTNYSPLIKISKELNIGLKPLK